MDNLEHDIEKAFAENDSNTKLTGKDEMWNRLESAIHKSKGVATIWRVAAVFVGLLLVAGAIVGLSYREKLHTEISAFQNQNAQLQSTIDSLLARPVEIQTETKVVEKVVYRDRVVQVNPVEKNNEWETKYQQLKDSTNRLITQNKNFYFNELLQLKAGLETANEKLFAYQNKSNEPEQTAKEPFQLKSEWVELDIKNTPVTKSQGIEVKFMPRSITGNKNNLNKSLLNNLP